MTTTLVTGGCGFVGRHLTRRLLQLGHQVWIIDNLSTGRIPEDLVSCGKIVFLQEDIREALKVSLPHFDYVFHLAAVVGGREKIHGDPVAVAVNISIDTDFFIWAVENRPGRIVYASSSVIYPVDVQSPGAPPLREDSISFTTSVGVPDMTYGWAKLTGEYLAQFAVKEYGLSICCVRPFSGYGEDQDEAYPIPAIARRVANREDPLHIWGPGTQGRDFIHIDDCIDLMLLGVNKIADGSAVNIGSGKLTTFLEVARIFAEIAGYSPTIVSLGDKPMGVHSRYADITKAKALGWEPKIPLEEGFRIVYESKRRD